ncbi:MAG TPA: DinB family protein [Candidatus Limnocylindria bacterium]
MPSAAWLEVVQQRAPDTAAVWRTLGGRLESNPSFRRELAARAGDGSAERLLAEADAIADALADALAACSEDQLRAPGGQEDWNVAQAFAHTTASRRWLVNAAAAAARSQWPDEEPVVRPGIPGPADASRELLGTYLAKSRRSMALSAAAIAGHETEPCPLDHPLVGFLRCGEWLLFAGVHDLMHLEQLHALIDAD